MTFSRRKFISAGIVATVCAGLPLKSALAAIAPDGPGTPTLPDSTASSIEQLDYYTRSTFAPYVNTKFRVHLATSNVRGITLREVTDNFDSMALKASASPGDECFSLLFTVPPGKPFTQDTYLVEHDALGTFYMFVVPVSAHSKKTQDFYEAVVYRRQQSARWQESIVVTQPQPAVGEVPTQNPQRVYAGGPVMILPGREDAKQDAKLEAKPDTKEERAIYRFRAEDSPSAKEKANRPRPSKRKTYPLTMAQAPNMNGLKLGMTSEQVLVLFPGSKTDEEVRSALSRPASPLGESSLTIRPWKYSTRSKFDGASQVILTFLDGRASTLYIGYDGPIWEHVDDFVAKFSEGRNLPAAENWEAYVGMDTQLKTLKGKDLELSLFAGGSNVNINYVQLRDLEAQRKLEERMAKAKKETTGRS